MKNEHIKPSKNAKSIIITLLALILGIATGLLLQYKAPKEVADTLSSYVFTPVYTMFMNALKMIVGPLVFCSIAASISSFSDLKTLGRIAAKIMALYVLTSAIAVFVGYVPVTSSVFTALFIAIIALSLGSPGVPRGNLVCIAILIPTIGVPPEAVSLIMGLYPLVGMITACTNVTGDAVVTTIAAKAEKLFDIEKFNS